MVERGRPDEEARITQSLYRDIRESVHKLTLRMDKIEWRLKVLEDEKIKKVKKTKK